jgi:hypothetical protein
MRTLLNFKTATRGWLSIVSRRHHRRTAVMTAVNNKQITGVIVKKILKTFYFCSNLGYGEKN